MAHIMLERLYALAREETALKETVQYLRECMGSFLKRQERVLVCFPNKGSDSLGGLLEAAVRELGAIPMLWGPDYRWKAMLQQAFSSRASAIIGPPLAVLGLTKLASHTHTPLYIHNVVLAGYPGTTWMLEGIQNGLDCNVWGCYGPGAGPMIGGFSCAKSRGIHLRDALYTAQIQDETGNDLPDGTAGQIVLGTKADASICFPTGEHGKMIREACICGKHSPRIMDFVPREMTDKAIGEITGQLLSWSSILDCWVARTHMGLELEIVHFPGVRLPKLPACAKLTLREWEPNRDMPFFLTGRANTAEYFA